MDLQKFMEDIKAVVKDGEQLLKAGAGELKAKTVAGAQSTDRMVRSHPYQTLALMLGLGLIAGLVATKAFSSESELEEAD